MTTAANPSKSSLPELPGKVFTFYSYKGGTGRSMLLANVAWQLASAGKRVLVVDWDLEAPGLHRYFRPFLGDDPELKSQEGVIDWLLAYWDARIDSPDEPVEQLVRKRADPRHYVRSLQTSSYLSGGSIDLLGAGRQDHSYASAVGEFEFTTLYDKLSGQEFIDVAKFILAGPGGYDYVLVDSRTGISETSGFCTVSLADTLIVCFTYNNQSVVGASNIARDIKIKAEQLRVHQIAELQNAQGEHTYGYRSSKFRLFAVPSRVDDYDLERLRDRQKYAWDLFNEMLTDVPEIQRASYWLGIQIRNHGAFAYDERLAVCFFRPEERGTVLDAVVTLTDRLTDGDVSTVPSLSEDQQRTLRVLFSAKSNSDSISKKYSAWEYFEQRLPDSEARSSLLESCLPLLMQLFSVVSVSNSLESPVFAQAMLNEAELVQEERNIAEVLMALGIVKRRIDADRQRIIFVDESVLFNWKDLFDCLAANHMFLELRDQLYQARRSWEVGGRSIAVLQAIANDFSQISMSAEQSTWLGKPNRQFLQQIKDVHAISDSETQARSLLASKELEYQERLKDSKLSAEKLEKAGRETEELLKQLAKIENEKAKSVIYASHAKLQRMWLIVAALSLFVLFPYLLYLEYFDKALRMRSELLLQAQSDSASLNPKTLGGTLDAARSTLKLSLETVNSLGLGLSNNVEVLKPVLPIGVQIVNKVSFLPNVQIFRGRSLLDTFERNRGRAESQINGNLRLMLRSYPWYVRSSEPTPKAIFGIKSSCRSDGPHSPIFSGKIYTAHNNEGLNGEPPHSLFVGTAADQSNSKLEQENRWEIRVVQHLGKSGSECIVGSPIWSSPPADNFPQVAFDSGLRYLILLTVTKSKTERDGLITIDELTWSKGSSAGGWVVARQPMTTLQDSRAVLALRSSLGENLHLMLSSRYDMASTIVALSKDEKWKFISEVGTIPKGAFGDIKTLNKVADDEPCASFVHRKRLISQYTNDQSSVDEISTFAYDDYCIAATRIVPNVGYIPANSSVVLLSVYLPPKDLTGDVRQIANVNFGFQPNGELKLHTSNSRPYSGWIAIEPVEDMLNKDTIIVAPLDTMALRALGESIMGGPIYANLKGKQ